MNYKVKKKKNHPKFSPFIIIICFINKTNNNLQSFEWKKSIKQKSTQIYQSTVT